MVKITTQDYIGMTVLEVIRIETVKKEYGGLFSESFMVSLNNKLVSEKDYNNVVIQEKDILNLIPLYVGG
ncbi:MAG: hypothetical protein K0Q97_772 [Bacillota bacterium]|jgi:sulfur carrier protein ThiS|nr:hypothetical protein [Bacillota bacterium]